MFAILILVVFFDVNTFCIIVPQSCIEPYSISRFHIVAVKLGYLFPELEEEADLAILALTPGASCERLEDMHLKRIRRPMFPLEDDFLEAPAED